MINAPHCIIDVFLSNYSNVAAVLVNDRVALDMFLPVMKGKFLATGRGDFLARSISIFARRAFKHFESPF
eukprot:scaffold1337_cov108-Skeletonema_dohrnii-CCMP3373.AAC.3